MQNNNNKFFVLFFILAAVFLFGVIKLFMLRFEAGDVYPAYSSMRSDPLGTRAFYESLKNFENFSVSRNHSTLPRMTAESGTTFFYLGAHNYEYDFYSEKSLDTINKIAEQGGRVVISFVPLRVKSWVIDDKDEDDIDGDEKNGEEKENKDNESSTNNTGKKDVEACENTASKNNTEENNTSKNKHKCKKQKKKSNSCCDITCKKVYFTERLGLNFGYGKKEDIPGIAGCTQQPRGYTNLPTVTWHTALYFKNLHEDWRVIYFHKGNPVIIERDFGKGSIVLSSDSYVFSNEAMRNERRPNLLTWFIGKNETIIFDESHLGIQEDLGIAVLARKYGLRWLFLGLILLAGLFVWKSSVYFVPPIDDEADAGTYDFLSSHSHTEGLVSLLRRNLKLENMLSVCSAEWRKSFASRKKVSNQIDEKLKKIQEVINSEKPGPGSQDGIVSAYKNICWILSKR